MRMRNVTRLSIEIVLTAIAALLRISHKAVGLLSDGNETPTIELPSL